MRELLAAMLFAVSGCGACEPDRAPPPGASTAATASAPPLASASIGRPSPGPHIPQPKLACRVVALDGDAHVEPLGPDSTAPLLLQGLAPPQSWIDLAAGGRVVARDPRTTRETTFHGPARVRMCQGFAEESWLASGSFQSSVGAGESPGAEEWVVTPSGVVRYTAADVSVAVMRHGTDATLAGGVAFAWGIDSGDAGATDEGWRRLPAGKTHLGSHEEAVSAAVDRCAGLASSARALAAEVMAPGGADAGTIHEQVTTRRLARAACAVASLRVNALPPADAAPFQQPVADAHSAWSGLPVGVQPAAVP
jgi:hypothetical protein